MQQDRVVRGEVVCLGRARRSVGMRDRRSCEVGVRLREERSERKRQAGIKDSGNKTDLTCIEVQAEYEGRNDMYEW